MGDIPSNIEQDYLKTSDWLQMKRDVHFIQALPPNGIYTLIIFLSTETCVNVGKLGPQKFQKGYYTYTGSALGKGASSLKHRVSRHLRAHAQKRNFWHIDFLLTNENATVAAVVAAQTNRKLECKLNHHIKREGGGEVLVKRFGASDCREDCESHLLFFPDIIKGEVLVQKVVECACLLGKKVFITRRANACMHEIAY